MTDAQLEAVRKYLDDDCQAALRAFDSWHLDGGKLQTAIEHAGAWCVDVADYLANPPAERPFIGRGPDTENLYRIEEALAELVKKEAAELGRILDLGTKPGEEGYWERSVPEALASVLDSFSPSIAIPAAVGYLQAQGFRVHLSGGGKTKRQLVAEVNYPRLSREGGRPDTAAVEE